MIATIFRHELRCQWRNGRVKTLLWCTTFLIVSTLILSYRNYLNAQEQYLENVNEVRLNWENQTEKDPHDAAHDGTYVIKPMYPLMFFDKGIRQYSGQVVHLGAHQRKISSINESKDSSGLFRFGELSISFILVYIFPLLIIFIGYNAFTQERENQTIRLISAQGASFIQLAIAKWLTIFFQIFLVSTPLIMAAFVFDFYFTEGLVDWKEWVGLALCYVLYFMAFISLAILVSAKCKTSGFSLGILLTIWILSTLIVPKLATNLSSTLYPFPKFQAFSENITEDKAKGINGHDFWSGAAEDFKQQVLKEYNVASVEELPVEFGGLLLAEGEKYESKIYTKHFNLLQEQYQKQRSVYRLSGMFSPMLPVRFTSMALTRTDYGFLWHFEDEAEQYRLQFNTALNMNIAENAKGVDNYKAEAALWSSIPKFQYQWQPGNEIFKDHMMEFIILFCWAIGSFLLMLLLTKTIKIA